MAGLIIGPNGASRGFVGLPGSLLAFDAPGAGTGSQQGTVAVFNDASNKVVGYVVDAQIVTRGFLRTP